MYYYLCSGKDYTTNVVNSTNVLFTSDTVDKIFVKTTLIRKLVELSVDEITNDDSVEK